MFASTVSSCDVISNRKHEPGLAVWLFCCATPPPSLRHSTPGFLLSFRSNFSQLKTRLVKPLHIHHCFLFQNLQKFSYFSLFSRCYGRWWISIFHDIKWTLKQWCIRTLNRVVIDEWENIFRIQNNATLKNGSDITPTAPLQTGWRYILIGTVIL